MVVLNVSKSFFIIYRLYDIDINALNLHGKVEGVGPNRAGAKAERDLACTMADSSENPSFPAFSGQHGRRIKLWDKVDLKIGHSPSPKVIIVVD